MVLHAWERVRPPSWVEVRLPSVSPGCGTPRPHGTWLPVPSLGVGLGKVEGSSSATLAMPTTGGRTGGKLPCQFIACRLAYGQRLCAGRRKNVFFLFFFVLFFFVFFLFFLFFFWVFFFVCFFCFCFTSC